MFEKKALFTLDRLSKDEVINPKDIHSLYGLKSNITYLLNWVTKKPAGWYKGDEKKRHLNRILNKEIVEYEIIEKSRMTVREYLEKSGKMKGEYND